MRILAVVAALLLSACSGDSNPPPQAGGAPNQADITFTQQMIPHHEQAVEMSRLVAGAGAGPEVRDLAAQVERAQGPEIRTMKAWLGDWGAEASSSHEGMEGHDGSEGMMSSEQMADLDRATGAEFDRLWMTLMIEHHEGAIAMAEREMRDGKNSEAIDLAEAIVDGQAAEIDQMKELLDE